MDGTPRRLLALAIVATIGAACDGAEPVAPATPTSAFASATPPSVPTGITGPAATGGLPTPDLGGAAGSLNEGVLRLQVSGAVELTTGLTRLLSGVAAPPPGGFAVVWSRGDADATTVGMGGGSFLGTRPTSPTLVLSVTAQTGEGLSTWVSSDGECDVTLEAASADRFAGAFACEGLTSGGGEAVDVSGVFEATG